MRYPNECTVTLHDGREVSNYSEAYRHECEARAVLAMPTKGMRQDYLWGALDQYGRYRGGVRQIRGEEATKRLEETILALWNAQRKAA
jgi:hypothetical protein